MLVAVIILGILCIGLVGLVLWEHTRPSGTSSDATLLLKTDMVQLTESVGKLQDGLQKHLTDRLDKSSDQMVKQFAESANIIRDVTQKLTELNKTNQQVGDIASELKVLQNVLQNPKQRGVLGEYYLASVLKNVLAPDQFSLQYRFKDGEAVDAVIHLDKKRLLPIDSKFSLENYNRLVEEKDPARRDVIANLFKDDLKKRIDETAKYIRPSEGTLDYAFMFIPSEAIYYDLLINKVGITNTSARDLIEYAFRDKHVIIVSPTTFMAYLQTVLQGLRSLQIEEQAKEIQQRVGELGRHITTYDQFMNKLGSSLGTTVNHYNAAHKELKKIDKDIIKIADTTPGVDPIVLDKPQLEE
jgi:DNA recombination protein RmuC